MQGVEMRGHVDTFMVAPDGSRTLVQPGSNTVLFKCADAVARLFAGRGGGPAAVVFVHDSSFDTTVGAGASPRSWQPSAAMAAAMATDTASSVTRVPLDPNPSVSTSSADTYAGNVVTLRATLTGDSEKSVYGYMLTDADNNVLAVRKLNSSVSKPANYALAVSWDITFS